MKILVKGGYGANGGFAEFRRFFRRAPALPPQSFAFDDRYITRRNRRNRNNITKIISYLRRDIRRYGGMTSALGFLVGDGCARVPGRGFSEKATTRPGWIARTPRQITVDYLASTTDRQARLSFLHPQHSPRKGKVRNDADMTTRRTRSRPEATSPETARNARGTQASRLPAPRLSETRIAARASRREERAAIARAAAILTTRKEPTYD